MSWCSLISFPVLSFYCDDLLLEEVQKGREISSLFLPTKVCQTGIFREQCSERFCFLVTKIGIFFFPLKDCVINDMDNKDGRRKVARKLQGSRDRRKCIYNRKMR